MKDLQSIVSVLIAASAPLNLSAGGHGQTCRFDKTQRVDVDVVLGDDGGANGGDDFLDRRQTAEMVQ